MQPLLRLPARDALRLLASWGLQGAREGGGQQECALCRQRLVSRVQLYPHVRGRRGVELKQKLSPPRPRTPRARLAEHARVRPASGSPVMHPGVAAPPSVGFGAGLRASPAIQQPASHACSTGVCMLKHRGKRPLCHFTCSGATLSVGTAAVVLAAYIHASLMGRTMSHLTHMCVLHSSLPSPVPPCGALPPIPRARARTMAWCLTRFPSFVHASVTCKRLLASLASRLKV